MYFHYWVTFTGNIRCFCATTSHDLAILTFDLLRMFHIQCFSCPTHIPILIILYDYRLLDYDYWIFDHISVRLSETSKMIHIFEIPNPNFSVHFVTFRALRRRLSHVINENSYKVHCASTVSSDLCIGVPKTTRYNFLTPNCTCLQYYVADCGFVILSNV